MSKIERDEERRAVSHLGELTTWDNNKEYGYLTGVCYTFLGIIVFYLREEAASARIIHNGYYYTLWIHEAVTKVGLVRIAKKWEKEVRAR